MKLGTLMSVCLRLVTQLNLSVGEASRSTLIMQSWHCDLTSRMARGSLKIISTYATTNNGVYGEDHNPTRKGLGTLSGTNSQVISCTCMGGTTTRQYILMYLILEMG
jgi:hypothetical protein